jgi:tricorn protease
MLRALLASLLCAVAAPVALAETESYDLLRDPTVSRTQIAFSYAGDIWVVDRSGGDARRLTANPGQETHPLFSPDGTEIVFTGQYDGNVDVYVVPASGGVPRRLTYHPGDDVALGWTPDGKRILFRSSRESWSFFDRLFTIPLEGEAGVPDRVPLPVAEEGSYSPDGSHLAYVPNLKWQAAWKRYRGGQTTPIWIASLADSSIERVPRENSNDFSPMWVGDRVYFLSDRSGPVSLFAYDTKAKTVTEVVKSSGFDLKAASAGPGAIAYEQFGAIHLYDIASGRSERVNIRVSGDLPEVRPGFRKVEAGAIQQARISPTGVRAVIEARGEVLTVPAAKGDVRNLTNSQGVADRDPAWSPDGKWIAYFSDASGEYALHLRDQTGRDAPKAIPLGAPSYFYDPTWSPDSTKIVFTDKRLSVWYVDVATGKLVKVDTDRYETPFRTLNPAWSPDGKWIAYTKQLQSNLRAVFIYSLDQARSYQVTDGLSDARNPVFDAGGKYLYFTASTDVALSSSWLDMSGINHPVSRSIYVAVLDKTLPSPLAPESDEEKPAAASQQPPTPSPPAGAPPSPTPPPPPPVVKIDVDKIGQRVLAMPIPAKGYIGLAAGKENQLILVSGSPVYGGLGDTGKFAVERFDLTTRKVEPLADGLTAFDVSANGEKMLVRQGDQWYIAPTASALKPGEGALKLADVEVYVDPRAEWRQMYAEVWRIERDFFYDPNLHGLNLQAVTKRYQPYVDHVASRADLNYIFEDMLGELTAGHVFVGGGDLPQAKPVKGGLLGADFTVEGGRYRFARVYDGENWNPDLTAPLTQPGVNVVAGEYLIAVGGKDLRAADSVYRALEDTAGKQVVLRVGPSPDGTGARDVTVVPVDSEQGLRNRAWIEDNRRKVDEMTGGRVAYVYMPNTAEGGYTNFNRYYFAQVGKQGAIIDERYNSGGLLADYVIDVMRRPPMSRVAGREGEDLTSPAAAIYGPKVMLVNEMAGSGGDAMPWYFRKAGIGPLVGHRTWGGLIGIFGYPLLADGGSVTAPRVGLYGLAGEWEVENRGITPDYEVDLDPKAWRAGHDSQLDKAVAVALELLAKNPVQTFKRPPYPKYQ